MLVARWATGCLRFQIWNHQLVLWSNRPISVTKEAFIFLKIFTIRHGPCKVFSVFFWKSLRLQPFLSQDCKSCIYSCRANAHACDVFRLLASPIFFGLGSFALNRKQSVKLDMLIRNWADPVDRSVLYHSSVWLPNMKPLRYEWTYCCASSSVTYEYYFSFLGVSCQQNPIFRYELTDLVMLSGICSIHSRGLRLRQAKLNRVIGPSATKPRSENGMLELFLNHCMGTPCRWQTEDENHGGSFPIIFARYVLFCIPVNLTEVVFQPSCHICLRMNGMASLR